MSLVDPIQGPIKKNSYKVSGEVPLCGRRYQPRKGWSFLRPVEGGKWSTVVNLLDVDTLGYLYNATFSTHGTRLLYSKSTYLMYMNFIWIHPVYWQKIKERLQFWVDQSPGIITLDRKLTN